MQFDHDLTHALNVVMHCHQSREREWGPGESREGSNYCHSNVLISAPALGECQIRTQ